jgi:hypothetical protein
MLRLFRKSSPAEGGPGEESRSKPGALERGRMRRRLRRQQRVREALLLDLGALVFELHRQGRREPELLQSKAAELTAVDQEVRVLAEALDADRTMLELVAPGIVGSCETCGALLTSDARFCSSCGAPTGAALDEPMDEARPGLAAAGDGAAEAGAAEAVGDDTVVMDTPPEYEEGVSAAVPMARPQDEAETAEWGAAEPPPDEPPAEPEESLPPWATVDEADMEVEEGVSAAVPMERPEDEADEADAAEVLGDETRVEADEAEAAPEPEEPEAAVEQTEAEEPPVDAEAAEATVETEEPEAEAETEPEPEPEPAPQQASPPPPGPRRPAPSGDVVADAQRLLRLARRRAKEWLDRRGRGTG